MGIPVLIATRTLAFGELAHQHLMFHGLYAPVKSESGAGALESAKNTPFEAAILDYDLEDFTQVGLAKALRSLLPRIRLVFVTSKNDQKYTDLEGIIPDAFLTKPFYYRDLLNIMDAALKNEPNLVDKSDPIIALKPEASHVLIDENYPNSTPAFDKETTESNAEPPPAWLQDVDRAAQYLTRLTFSSASQAALIVQNGQMRVYAGQLHQPAAQELAQAVGHYWEKDGGSDLARFVRLDSSGGEYILYATSMGWGMVLALVFDAETPFGKIRSQAVELAQALASPPPDENDPVGSSLDKNDSWFVEPGPDADHLTNLPPLFDDIPPPFVSDEPPGGSKKAPTVSHSPKPADLPLASVEMELNSDRDDTIEPSFDSAYQPFWGPDPLLQTEQKKDAQISSTDADAKTGQALNFLPASYAIYHLNYASVLIPRLPQHQLLGELSASLNNWIPQLCLAFGWRLLHLSIQVNYLHWVVDVPPATSPAGLVQLLRQHTSSRIFPLFPQLAKENPSGDFWAPGYLLTSSMNPLPEHLIKAFVEKTRSRQGAKRPFSGLDR